jgi:hypothetical protein
MCSVVYRDITQQAKGLYRLKHVGALRNGLMYLSRYNSGWFYHTADPTRRSLADRRLTSPAAILRARHANPPLPELRRGRHARCRSLTLPLAHCVLFSNLKHVLSPHCILSSIPATTISPTFLSLDPAPHRTSATPPGHRRQPPTPPPDPDPVLLEDHRDSL